MHQVIRIDLPAVYRIRVQGHISPQWADYLGGLSVCLASEAEQGTTILTGQVMDQAALIGIINSLYGLGFPLLSVEYQSRPPQGEVA